MSSRTPAVIGLTYTLPDGSTALVEQVEQTMSRISRLVAGEVVWGQVFARREDHAGQVADVLDAMAQDPDGFRRWWL